MNKQDFIDKWKHEIAGLILDGATSGRSGADLALWLRGVMKKVDARLGDMHDSLKPPPAALPVKPETKGVAK